MSFGTCVVCPRPIVLSQTRKYDAENILRVAVLPWSGAHCRYLLETRKHSALAEAEDSEPEPEPESGCQGRAITVSKLTESLGLTETCIKVFEDIYPKEQQEAAIRQGIMRILTWYEEILRRRRNLWVARLQFWISSSHLRGLLHRHLYCWTVGMMIQIIHLQFLRKGLHLKLSFVCDVKIL
jgi:hypothetical protein